MATKKKSRKKPAKPGKPARKKAASKKAAPRKAAKPAKKAAKKIAVRKVAKPAKKTAQKKAANKKQFRIEATRTGRTRQSLETVKSHLGDQAGDLQGLSRREAADSESVDELLEEGNAFEAGIVGGVEEADDADESEVHTHEVLEDDVPEEYLDKDQ
jgi:hypothetical protein